MAMALVVTALAVLAAQDAKPVAAKAEPALLLEATIELPNVKGRIDHLAITRDGARLFVAALENDSLEVVDLKAGKHERSLAKQGAPAGVVTFGDPERVAFACGETGKLEVLDAKTLEKVASVEVGEDADNVRFDARHGRIVVAHGSGALAIVDASTWKVTGSVELGAHPEGFQLDRAGLLAFVNLPDRRSVVVVDLPQAGGVVIGAPATNGRIAATVVLEDAQANFPMLWLEPGGQLVVGCREPGRLLFVDAPERKQVRAQDLFGELQAVPLSGDVDDLFHDLRRDRIYASCGVGVVDVFERAHEPEPTPGPGWRLKERAATAKGARTCLFSREQDRLYVGAPARDKNAARVLVLAPRP